MQILPGTIGLLVMGLITLSATLPASTPPELMNHPSIREANTVDFDAWPSDREHIALHSQYNGHSVTMGFYQIKDSPLSFTTSHQELDWYMTLLSHLSSEIYDYGMSILSGDFRSFSNKLPSLKGKQAEVGILVAPEERLPMGLAAEALNELQKTMRNAVRRQAFEMPRERVYLMVHEPERRVLAQLVWGRAPRSHRPGFFHTG